MQRIFLIGLPGAGKSFLSEQLATKLGWQAVDTDQLIEQKFQQSVAQLFAEQGESFFRLQERAVLNDLLMTDNVVVATGGGLPCVPENMELIRKNSISVWLNMPLKELEERIVKDGDKRPYFAGKGEGEIIRILNNLLAERDIYYKQAMYTIAEPEDLYTLPAIKVLLPHG